MPDGCCTLTGSRVLAALNGLELFGHERGNIEVFKTLRDLGAEVVVGLNDRPDNQVREELHRLAFATFPLPFGIQWSLQWVKNDPRVILYNPLAVWRCSWLLRRRIRAYRPTHVHLGSPLAYSYLCLALSVRKLPLVYRMGDCPPADSPFNLRIWRMAMHRCSSVVANSQFVRDAALAAGVSSRRLSVIYNLAPSAGETVGSECSPEARDSPERLLYVGAVSEHKGLVPLLNAFSKLAGDYPSIELDIVGGSRYDRPFRDQLNELVASRRLNSRVHLHGHVADPSDFYRFAAIHIAPSIWDEPAGTVVLEAKREGTPSVVFPSGGLPEMVRHRVDGYVCRERSADALVEGLMWMLSDKKRLAQMGSAAKEDSGARFGKARFARAWADVYRRASAAGVE
jgi:glycosyltransferase involved in cell wall biosynthesis